MGPKDASPSRPGCVRRESNRIRLGNSQIRPSRPRIRPRRPSKDRKLILLAFLLRTWLKIDCRTPDTPLNESLRSSISPMTPCSSLSDRSTSSYPISCSRLARPRTRGQTSMPTRVSSSPSTSTLRDPILGAMLTTRQLRSAPARLLHRSLRCLSSVWCGFSTHLGPCPRSEYILNPSDTRQ